MKLTEAEFLAILVIDPGGHCRKPHYWFKRETRAIYFTVWKAWLKGLCTCPLFDMQITEAGRRALQTDTQSTVEYDDGGKTIRVYHGEGSE